MGVAFKGNMRFGPGSILFNMLAMLANNLLMFTVWFGFFHRFPEVGGWTKKHMELMYGIGVSSFVILVIYADGIFELAYTIAEGKLDPLLVQPKPVLLSMVLGKSEWTGLGEFATGAILFYVGWPLLGSWWPILPLFILTALFIWAAFGIALGTLALYIDRFDEAARSTLYSIVIFATKPGMIYTTRLKWLVFTVIPVGYMTYLPVSFFDNPSLSIVLYVLGGSCAALGASLLAFHHGLKRYTSQNRLGFANG